jgi:hypothetical protein
MVHMACRFSAEEGSHNVASDFIGVSEDGIRSGGFVHDTERAMLRCLTNTLSYAE